MTREEYKEKLKQLEQEFEHNRKELAKTCALANRVCEIGDVISDFHDTIKVESFILTSVVTPSVAYKGVRLKKNLTPFKNNEKVVVYNVLKVNGSPIKEN